MFLQMEDHKALVVECDAERRVPGNPTWAAVVGMSSDEVAVNEAVYKLQKNRKTPGNLYEIMHPKVYCIFMFISSSLIFLFIFSFVRMMSSW